MKNNTIRLANTFALAMVILWVLCSAIVWLLPDLYWQATTWMMHGKNFTMGSGNLTLSNFILGGIVAVISAWVTGWALGWAWEVVGGNNRK